jgi:4-amino-4-deoxy-L-arabinose transferase-like glycosyltransferase
MEKTAQVVSCTLGLLLVVPMYFLGRELFSSRVAFWAALFFQCLPSSGRVLSDGLSEATFFFFFALAAWQGVRGVRTMRLPPFALCGIFGALAYLTRPEGAIIVLATGLALVIAAVTRAIQQPWRKMALCAATLIVSAVVAGCPLYLVTGKISPKPAFDHVGGVAQTDAPRTEVAQSAPLLAVIGVDRNLVQGFKTCISESVKAFNYAGWLPVLLGLWWHRSLIKKEPKHWVLLLIMPGFALVMWRVATLEGYLSDRHALVLVFCGVYWMVAGLEALPGKLAALAQRWQRTRLAVWCGAGSAPVVLIAALVIVCLPRTLQRLHYNRSGFRDAGLWLAEHTTYVDPIFDPYCWSHYYAGRVFIEDQDTSDTVPDEHQPAIYVVLEEAGNPHPHLPEVVAARDMIKQQPNDEVYRWKGKRGREDAEIAVYRLHSPPHANQ